MYVIDPCVAHSILWIWALPDQVALASTLTELGNVKMYLNA